MVEDFLADLNSVDWREVLQCEDVDEAAVELSEDLHDGVFSQPHSRHNSGHSSGTASRHNSGHSVHGGRKKRSFRHSDDVSGRF